MTDVTRTASVERPFDPNGRREPRETETVSSRRRRGRARVRAPTETPTFRKTSRDLAGSFERFGVSVDGLANGPEPVTRMSRRSARKSSPRARACPRLSRNGLDGWRRRGVIAAGTAEQSFAKLAA